MIAYSWLYPKPNDDNEDSRGQWDQRLFTSRDDLRKLSILIKASREAFDDFRNHKDLERAYTNYLQRQYELENKDYEKDMFSILAKCESLLQDFPLRLSKNELVMNRLKDSFDSIRSLMDNIA